MLKRDYYDGSTFVAGVNQEGHSVEAVMALEKYIHEGNHVFSNHHDKQSEQADHNYKISLLKDAILKYEISYYKESDLYEKLSASRFIKELKSEYNQFILNDAIPGLLTFSHGHIDQYNNNGQYMPNDSKLLQQHHQSQPFTNKDIKNLVLGPDGLKVIVGDYYESDGYGQDYIYFIVPSSNYRDLDSAELNTAKIIISEFLSKETYIDINFSHSVQNGLFGKTRTLLDYSLIMKYGKRLEYKKEVKTNRNEPPLDIY